MTLILNSVLTGLEAEATIKNYGGDTLLQWSSRPWQLRTPASFFCDSLSIRVLNYHPFFLVSLIALRLLIMFGAHITLSLKVSGFQKKRRNIFIHRKGFSGIDEHSELHWPSSNPLTAKACRGEEFVLGLKIVTIN